jgi:thiamine biosynthesis protein ThiS
MKLIINGDGRTLAPPVTSIAALLEQLHIPAARTAVELNGAVVEHRLFGETALRDGDRLEIVSFVGGG